MKYLLVILLFPLSVNAQVSISSKSKIADKAEKEIIVKATVLQIQGTNKAGRPLPGSGDFYLLYKNEEHFIKFSESKIKPEQLNRYIGKKCEFRIIERNGLWDTDNPEVQSRIGDYVSVLEILNR